MIVREYPDGTVDLYAQIRCYYASPSRVTATLNFPVSYISKPCVFVTPEQTDNAAANRGLSCRYRLIGDPPYTSVEVNVTDTNQIFGNNWAKDASVHVVGKVR